MPKGVYPRIPGKKRGPRLHKRTPLSVRFWAKVNKTEACWLWTGAVHDEAFPYGLLGAPGGSDPPLRAHRVSWELHNGPIPDGLFVCHHCDNPICVRPDHLFLGTCADNIADGLRKGRPIGHRNPTHCKRGHPLSGANLGVQMRQSKPMRVCLTCRRARDRAAKRLILRKRGAKVSGYRVLP